MCDNVINNKKIIHDIIDSRNKSKLSFRDTATSSVASPKDS